MTNTSDWYFGSPDLVATGQNEFQRVWGSVPLEDNWRRSNRSPALSDPSAPVGAANPGQTQDE